MTKHDLEYTGEARGEGTWLFSLSGNLYGTRKGYAFQEQAREQIASGTKNIVIDLAGVDKIDSCGVGILVATMWSASQAGAELILATLSPKVEKVLSIAMLLDHIHHTDSLDEALARIEGANPTSTSA